MERKTKVLALVAHDNMKRDLAEWVDWNSRKLSRHHWVGTGTTGKMVEKTLCDHREEHEDETEEKPELKITLLKSGPLGGDQQLGLYESRSGFRFVPARAGIFFAIRSRPEV